MSTAVIRYTLKTEKLCIAAHLAARKRVTTEAEFEEWKKASKTYQFKDQVLCQFDPREVRLDLGSAHPVSLVIQKPILAVDEILSYPMDNRLKGHEDCIERISVMFYMTNAPHDDKLDQGHYNSDSCTAFVEWENTCGGRYRVIVDGPNLDAINKLAKGVFHNIAECDD